MAKRLSLLLCASLVGCASGAEVGVHEDLVEQQNLVVAAAADAYVRSGSYASSNYGTKTTLQIDTDESNTETLAFVRFAVPALSGIQSAKLRLYCTNSSSNAADIVQISDASWSESTLTWNSKPAIDGALIKTLTSVSSSKWVEIDVTAYVASGQPLSLALRGRSSDGVDFSSKEASSNRPELVIVSGGCGDGVCVSPEDCNSCASDCGSCSDTTAPSVSITSPAPTTYTAAATIAINASASDNVGVTKVEFYRNGALAGTDTASPYSQTWSFTAADNGTHSWTAKAYDAAGNIGTSSAVILTVAFDSQAPSAPTGLTAVAASSTQINLSWSAATDNQGVAGYDVYRNGTPVGSTTSLSYADTGLVASTQYSYTVKAFDLAGNISAASASAVATTSAAPSANLIFVGDFEAAGNFAYGGTYSQFSTNVDSCEHDQMCTTDSLEIVNSPVRAGSRAVRMNLKSTDTQETSGTRVELQSKGFFTQTLEEDYWYGWSIYLPADWVFDANDMKVVHQWHTESSQPGGSPIIGLRIKGDKWYITREFTEGNTITLWTGTATRGVWTDWVMHIRWSPTTTGAFKAFMNGTQVYAEAGQNMNSGTTAGGHYQKFGMYGSFGGSVQERTLFYDEVRVAKGADGYSVVAPAGSPGSGGGGGTEPPPAATLPGSIAGVEPEAHSHHPPMLDGNGNLYRITESTLADGNRPKMMKSTDGGITWVEVDSGNRPTAHDLEGTWQLQVGTSIYFLVTRDSDVWLCVFNTSDAASQADKWVTQEVVDSGLSSSSVKQYSSLARTSDGKFWAFYSDTLVSGRQQIGFRRRTGTNTYSAKVAVDSSTGSWTAPVAVVGKNDVTHLFYKDHLNHRLYWRTLSAAGVLSAATRIDTSGTSSVVTPHTNAVYYDRSGTEIITIAFRTAAGALKAVTITGGVVGAEQTITSTAVMENPYLTTNDGAVAHLALDGTTVRAMWSDAASGDLKASARADGGSFGTATTVWDSSSSEAHYVYQNVFVRNGYRRMGFVYDVGPHADDAGNIKYNEVVLGIAP